MKLVKEYINEKFTDESDPVKDMHIGKIRLIEMWLDKMEVTGYSINDDFSIDVMNNVDLERKLNGNLPKYIQFNYVKGCFLCKNCNMTTLRGCPKKLGYYFDCSNNNLKSLKYMPLKASHVYCHSNVKLFTVDEVLNLCDVEKTIFTKNYQHYDYENIKYRER